MRDYLDNGNIVNSVNLPVLSMAWAAKNRVCVLTKGADAAAIAAAADNLISHPENDDIDWTPDEFVSDWNDLHRGEEPLK